MSYDAWYQNIKTYRLNSYENSDCINKRDIKK